MSFAISSGLAAIAGILVAPVTLAEATMGNILGLKAFAVAIIGGLDSPRGIFISALGYGMFEALCAGYIYPGIRDALGFLLVILVLLIRPSGLSAASRSRRCDGVRRARASSSPPAAASVALLPVLSGGSNYYLFLATLVGDLRHRGRWG